MCAAIEIDDLVVVRGRRTVLPGLTTRIEAGRVTGLLGPSGSGKTTLMRAVVGVQQVRSGQVTVLGLPAGSRPLRSRVGYLTQEPSVYADLTVRENVRYFAALYGLGANAADAAIRDVGLADAERQVVNALSGGQRSRASLACALVGRPDVLVLDEPTVGQDPVLRDELWSRFRALAAAGCTLLVSSHVMDEANRCDHLILIRDGRVIADEPPASLKARAGTDDLDAAFLTLVRRLEGGSGPRTEVASWSSTQAAAEPRTTGAGVPDDRGDR